MIIAVDASGGEHAPSEIVKGAIKAAQEYEVDITLVGKKDALNMLTRRHSAKTEINIVEASQVIDFNESPIRAIQGKPDSSIVVGTNLVRDGKSAAFVSAGNSGAVAAAALINLGKIKGIPRPAIGSFLNITPSTPAFLIDAGANVDCRPEHMVLFAHLGSIYVSKILGLDAPRVGLLSNGEEANKGNKLTKESHELLKKSPLNFIGNIEGHDILKSTADVIVTDGFTGNIVLKTLEGISDTWLYSLGQVGHLFAKAYRIPVRALNRDAGIDSWAKKLDYQEYGGACLLGVNGTVIIAHGRSRAKAIKNAIGLAKLTAEREITKTIKEEGYAQTDYSAGLEL
ncbi:phosphate acyltransferase PlsX [Chloroflexota bacterium]